MQVQTLSANGKTNHFKTSKSARGATMIASGTWGSGTLTLEILLPDNTWLTVPGSSLGADDSFFLEFPESVVVRASLTGATAPSLQVVFV